MNDELRNLISEASQGNPGFINVAMSFYHNHDPLKMFCSSMLLTGSKGSDLWRLCKDVHDGDTSKTWQDVNRWMNKIPPTSLGQYVDERKAKS